MDQQNISVDQDISVAHHDISLENHQNVSVDHYCDISEDHWKILVEYLQAYCQIYVYSSGLNCTLKPKTCLSLYFSALNNNRIRYIVFCIVNNNNNNNSFIYRR